MSAVPQVPEPIVEYVQDTDGDQQVVDPRPTIVFAGKRFAIRDQGVSLLSLMKFATIAKRGLKTEDLEGLTALYTLLQSCIADDQWAAFEAHADKIGAQGEQLMHVVRDAVQAAAARPTRQPSDSPGGQSTTAPSSAAGSSDPDSSIRQGDPRVQTALEQRGRPDLALVVQRAREASTAS